MSRSRTLTILTVLLALAMVLAACGQAADRGRAGYDCRPGRH